MAINLALDANRYSDLCRGNPAIVAAVANANTAWLPFVVWAELLAGFAVGSRGFENEAILRRFLLKPGVGVLYPDHFAGAAPFTRGVKQARRAAKFRRVARSQSINVARPPARREY